MIKKYISIFIIIMLSLVLLTGCAQTTSTEKKVEEKQEKQEEQVQNETEQEVVDINTFDFEAAANNQMSKPKNGETIAIIKVKDFGEMKVKFFENIAPKAVENFTTHAKNGYYDGLTFHRVIKEFMIQGGDPDGNGMGGESIWGTGFGTELSYELVPYRGSLCMAMSSLPNSIGSQFFITQANYDEEIKDLLASANYPAGLINQYEKYGGYLSLYLQYTVFGQVYEGLDVLDEIANVKTKSVPLVINGVDYGTQDDKPVNDVVIETIEITTYKEN